MAQTHIATVEKLIGSGSLWFSASTGNNGESPDEESFARAIATLPDGYQFVELPLPSMSSIAGKPRFILNGVPVRYLRHREKIRGWIEVIDAYAKPIR